MPGILMAFQIVHRLILHDNDFQSGNLKELNKRSLGNNLWISCGPRNSSFCHQLEWKKSKYAQRFYMVNNRGKYAKGSLGSVQ